MSWEAVDALLLEMPKEYENVKYFGLGPDVNLPDYKEHTFNGIFETTVDNLKEDYIKPQESATRCDTRFAEITDINKRLDKLEEML